MTATPTLVALVEEYLALRRQLGFALLSSGRELLGFCPVRRRRRASRPDHRRAGRPLGEVAPRCQAVWWARRLQIVRGFARHRSLFDPGTEIPPAGLFGPSSRRPHAAHLHRGGDRGVAARGR